MNEATIALTVMTFLIFIIFLGFLIWGIRSGQFRNVEEAKYLPFEDDDPATRREAMESPVGRKNKRKNKDRAHQGESR